MTCVEIGEHVSACVDGELPADLAATVEQHLSQCSACRARAASLRALKHAVARFPSREEPPGAVRARVEALRFSSRRARAVQVLTWLATLAAGIAITVGAVHLR